MRLLNISKEKSLLNFFKKKQVVTIQYLMEFSQLSLSSVKRRLSSWKAYNSYNYNRSYYVLPEIAKFNSDGIWGSHQPRRISKKSLIYSSVIKP
jgi:RecA-family ATPase